jgi:hypothetical protein
MQNPTILPTRFTPCEYAEAQSIAAHASATSDEPHAVLRFVTGFYVARCLVAPARWLKQVKKQSGEIRYVVRSNDDGPSSAGRFLSVARVYEAGRQTFPANAAHFNHARDLSAWPQLKDARLYAMNASKAHAGRLVYLVRSNNRLKQDKPFFVFNGKVPHASMPILGTYIDGVEHLTQNAEGLALLSAAVTLPMYSVTYRDAMDREHNQTIRASSAADAWEQVFRSVMDEDGSIVCYANTRPIEIEQLTNGTENDTVDRDALAIYEEWIEERGDLTNYPTGIVNPERPDHLPDFDHTKTYRERRKAAAAARHQLSEVA